MEKEVAFEVDHESVEVLPDCMEDGEAESEQVGVEGGGVAEVTCTAPEHVAFEFGVALSQTANEHALVCVEPEVLV